MGTIANARNRPINVQTGSIPNLGVALLNWFQPMVFERVEKETVAFQVVETGYETSFRGVIMPFKDRELQIVPEGERAWTWLKLYSDPSLSLNVDEVVKYLGIQTRIMARKDYTIYGYLRYTLVQDWTGSGPEVEEP